MNQMKEIVAYCARTIVDWDLKSELAVRMIGRHMPIDPGFRNQIEDAVKEWCDYKEVCYDEVDWEEESEKIVLWAE